MRRMTYTPYLAKHLAGRRNGAVAHVHCLSGRAARAAVYPLGLLEAIVRGLQAQCEADHRAGRAECPVSSAIEQAAKTTDEELKTVAFA